MDALDTATDVSDPELSDSSATYTQGNLEVRVGTKRGKYRRSMAAETSRPLRAGRRVCGGGVQGSPASTAGSVFGTAEPHRGGVERAESRDEASAGRIPASPSRGASAGGTDPNGAPPQAPRGYYRPWCRAHHGHGVHAGVQPRAEVLRGMHSASRPRDGRCPRLSSERDTCDTLATIVPSLSCVQFTMFSLLNVCVLGCVTGPGGSPLRSSSPLRPSWAGSGWLGCAARSWYAHCLPRAGLRWPLPISAG